jgi:hypothetical protein
LSLQLRKLLAVLRFDLFFLFQELFYYCHMYYQINLLSSVYECRAFLQAVT